MGHPDRRTLVVAAPLVRGALRRERPHKLEVSRMVLRAPKPLP